MKSLNDFSLDRNHPLDLSEQIGRKIIASIENGELEPGQRLPGERNLAQLFRVSKDTVRKGISIAVERGYVTKRPSRGNYVTSPEMLAETRTRRKVCTFLHMDSFCPWEELVRGLSRELHRLGLELVIVDTCPWSIEEFAEKVTASIQDDAAGLIIYPYHLDKLEGFYRKLTEQAIPTVMIDAGMNLGLDAVVVDDDAAISLAVRHLYAQGHRQIGYAHVEAAGVIEHHERRLAAYRKACLELGIQPELMCCKLPANAEATIPSPGLRAQFRKYLSKTSATGVVCFNDAVAAALWAAAEDAGLSVPQDISIVGYDNDRAVESWAHPLTTIDPKLLDMGILAARRLAQLLEGTHKKGQITLIHPQLIVRDSTAELTEDNNEGIAQEA